MDGCGTASGIVHRDVRAVMVFGAWLPAMSVWLKLGLQIVCGAAVYIVLAAAFRLEKLLFSGGMVKERLKTSNTEEN